MFNVSCVLNSTIPGVVESNSLGSKATVMANEIEDVQANKPIEGRQDECKIHLVCVFPCKKG